MDIADVVESIDTKGYQLVPGFLAGQELVAAQDAIHEYFPRPADTSKEDVLALKHAVPFPLASNALNRIPFDSFVLGVAEKLLGREDIRLTSSFIQAKYGTDFMPSSDQSLHNDSWNASSLLWPRPEGNYQRLFGIVYMTDVNEFASPTRVVDRASHLGVPLLDASGKASYSPESYPKLYEMERPIIARAGDLLLFVGDLVHRGTAYRLRQGMRAAMFFNLHSQAATWTDKHIWSSRPAAPGWKVFSDLVAGLSVRQRRLLAFPEPGDSYWTGETIDGLVKLYPDIDVSPYQQMLVE